MASETGCVGACPAAAPDAFAAPVVAAALARAAAAKAMARAAQPVSSGRGMAEMLLRPAKSGKRGSAECPASSPSALPGFPKAYAQHLPSMAVPDSTSQGSQARSPDHLGLRNSGL